MPECLFWRQYGRPDPGEDALLRDAPAGQDRRHRPCTAQPLHDTLNAVAAAAHAAITGCVGHPRCQCPKSRAWLSWAFAEVCRGVRVGSWY
jgi:hypothetical protein